MAPYNEGEMALGADRDVVCLSVDMADRAPLDLVEFDQLARSRSFINEKSHLKIIVTEDRMFIFGPDCNFSRAFNSLLNAKKIGREDLVCAANLDINYSTGERVISGSSEAFERMRVLSQIKSDEYKKGELLEILGPGFRAA